MDVGMLNVYFCGRFKSHKFIFEDLKYNGFRQVICDSSEKITKGYKTWTKLKTFMSSSLFLEILTYI